MKKEHIPYIVSSIFFILALVGIGSGVYFYRQYKTSEAKLNNPEEASREEMQELVAKVGKLMVLPAEEPQVATVTDVENLKKTQPFFQDAVENDKVLLFMTAKKAILYRPSTNVIVNVAPIIDQGTATGAGQLTSTTIGQGTEGQHVRVALRNGTGVVGVTKKLEEELQAKVQNVLVTEKDNAKRVDYEKTLVIPLVSTLNTTVIQQLANELSATVSSLPADEPKPAADLLIIAGKDRE